MSQWTLGLAVVGALLVLAIVYFVVSVVIGIVGLGLAVGVVICAGWYLYGGCDQKYEDEPISHFNTTDRRGRFGRAVN